MRTGYAIRLAKIEARLPKPRIGFTAWVLGKAKEDQVMILKFFWMHAQFEKAGVGFLSNEFQRELQPHESPVMALCRLSDIDYPCMIRTKDCLIIL